MVSSSWWSVLSQKLRFLPSPNLLYFMTLTVTRIYSIKRQRDRSISKEPVMPKGVVSCKAGVEVSQQDDVYKNEAILERVYNVCKMFWRELELNRNTMRSQKISSVCKYCRCNPAVTMVRMRAEFVGPFVRHGLNLQIIEPRLRIVLCVYNVQENREVRCMWNAVCNPFLECKKHETGWHSSSTLWGIWRTWHKCLIHGVADRLWLMKIWWVQWMRRFKRTDNSPFRHFPCIFHKSHDHFFTKLCLIYFVFGNCVHAGCRKCIRMNTKWNKRRGMLS
jgi:hypothetical protein